MNFPPAVEMPDLPPRTDEAVLALAQALKALVEHPKVAEALASAASKAH